MRGRATIGVGILVAGAGFSALMAAYFRSPLTSAEWDIADTLTLTTLPALAPDPSNRVADTPAAALLGKHFFFDVGMSRTGSVACATCHLPNRQFQDDKPRATAIGGGTRRTMPLKGTAWGSWFFWDGRKDSQWSQALGPLEDPAEHGADRTSLVRFVLERYGREYREIFGPPPEYLPNEALSASPLGDDASRRTWSAFAPPLQDAVNRVFADIGKAIAAYERTLRPQQTRFDRFMARRSTWRGRSSSDALTAQEIAGLKLFIGKAQCTNCHEGPRFTDDHFHNTGVAAISGLPPDTGRAGALAAIDADPFNCLGHYSDAKAEACGELKFMSRNAHDLTRAYKPPSLRGVADRPPYMHAGQLPTIEAVVAHYNAAPAAPAGHSELKPLALSATEQAALVAFLKALSP